MFENLDDFEETFEKIGSPGISASILALLNAPSKKEAEKIIQTMSIEWAEFVSCLASMHAKPPLGLKYERYFADHLPAQYKIEDSDLAGDAKKLIGKLAGHHNQKKIVCAHIFSKDATKWHCFYFSEKDITGQHWKYGPHIHYISYMWDSRLTLQELKKKLSDRKIKLNGEHIRFKPKTVC